jgi:hypothetical protein
MRNWSPIPSNDILSIYKVQSQSMKSLIHRILFYAIGTPVGLTMRAFGWNPLKRGFDHTVKSYWIDCLERQPYTQASKKRS